jgi:hypothetical protein
VATPKTVLVLTTGGTIDEALEGIAPIAVAIRPPTDILFPPNRKP